MKIIEDSVNLRSKVFSGDKFTEISFEHPERDTAAKLPCYSEHKDRLLLVLIIVHDRCHPVNKQTFLLQPLTLITAAAADA